MNIGDLKPNKNNPRFIKDNKFRKLVNSIKKDPDMMELRPIIIDKNNIILGGNMRYKALIALGYKEIPNEWVKRADKLTKEQRKRFIVKDNISYGEDDWEILERDWSLDELKEYGKDVDKLEKKRKEQEGDIEFSEFLDEEHNYVILLFDNKIDWLSAQTHFELNSVHSKRANGKAWSKGIGRVIDGAKYLNKIKE